MSTETLYQIESELLALQAALEAQEQSPDEAITDQLTAFLRDYQWREKQKVDGYGALVRELETRVQSCKDEVDRLLMRRRVAENVVKHLKALAGDAMMMRGVRKLEGSLFTLAIQKNGGKPPVDVKMDPWLLPDEYVRIERTADKEKMRAAMEAQGKDYLAVVLPLDEETEETIIAELGELGESVRVR